MRHSDSPRCSTESGKTHFCRMADTCPANTIRTAWLESLPPALLHASHWNDACMAHDQVEVEILTAAIRIDRSFDVDTRIWQ